MGDSTVSAVVLDREKCQLAILWLDEMSNEGLHKFSNDLLAAIDLISEMRRELRYGNAARIDRRIF